MQLLLLANEHALNIIVCIAFSLLFDMMCLLIAAVAGGITPCNFLAGARCCVAMCGDSSTDR
jgi:hypothetical protein